MPYKSIALLDDIVARQIAAGEVIDRPSAILRELLDNSIDSHASKIEVQVINSGIDLLQVSDNGTGMKVTDLALCCLPHATSKITTSEELTRIQSMGFRGEALPSISAVSKVTIHSKHEEDAHAWKIEAYNTKITKPTQSSRSTGTTVKAERLFQDIPARRKFLSSAQSELSRLKTMLYTKAAAFPDISFSLLSDGQTLVTLSKETALARSIRVCAANSRVQDFLWIEEQQKVRYDSTEDELNSAYQEYRLQASLGLPEVAQKSRRHIHIYINKRPVKEFAILQAIEYAYRNVLHGAKYPQAVVFLAVPPEELDVNIHPAKTEVKIRHIEPIRKLIISSIEQRLQNLAQTTPSLLTAEASYDKLFPPTQTYKETSSERKQGQQISYPTSSYHSLSRTDYFAKKEHSIHSSPSLTGSIARSLSKPAQTINNNHQKEEILTTRKMLQSLKSERNTDLAQEQNRVPVANKIAEDWHYIGTIFATYLIFEQNVASLGSPNRERELLIVDFHASHERILYDSLVEKSTAMTLLVPVPLKLDMSREDISRIIAEYTKIGIIIEEDKENHFVLTAVPENSPIDVEKIAELVESSLLEDELNSELFARRACRTAAKAGDHVDLQGAYALLDKVLALKIPRCPHGRPLWLTLSKLSLDRLIGRIE